MTISPGAYYGHAPVTWDTVTAQRIIDATNAHIANSGIHGGGGGYAAFTFCDVFMSAGGGTSIQSLPSGNIYTLNLDQETSDAYNCFDPSSHLYYVPSDGLYACSALVRCRDNQWNNVNGDNLGIGIRANWEANADPTTSFKWDKIQTLAAGGGRYTVDHSRIAQFYAGNTLQLYAYQDSGVTRDLYSASMQIYRVG